MIQKPTAPSDQADPGGALDHDAAVQYLAEYCSITRDEAEQALLEAVASNSLPVFVQLEDGNWIKLTGELAIQFMGVECRDTPDLLC